MSSARDSSILRVLTDAALEGPSNMARDEALLQQVGPGLSPPTLRFFQWDPPTISLGYFQRFADFEALPEPARSLAVVRRPTGGGAILHDRELTYSVTMPLAHPALKCGPSCLYEYVHDALIACLAESGISAVRSGISDQTHSQRGPFFCFARRHALDVLIGPDKVAGSAQRRTRTAVLQHGSIVFERRYAQQSAAELGDYSPDHVRRVAESLTRAFADRVEMTATFDDWRPEELRLADEFSQKHASQEWLRLR